MVHISRELFSPLEIEHLNSFSRFFSFKVPADLGKVLLHPNFGEEPQWAVVGESCFVCFSTVNFNEMYP